jgi:pyrroloquinoline quinone (PQQ) biosynthesis protein C
MLQRSLKRDRTQRQAARRQNQRRYEARQRAGIGLYPVPLNSHDIDVLIGLHYLREGAERDRKHVGEAVAAVIRELGRAFGNRDH